MISPELIIFVSSLGVGDNELLPAADFLLGCNKAVSIVRLFCIVLTEMILRYFNQQTCSKCILF